MEPKDATNNQNAIRDVHGLTSTHYTIFSYLTTEPPLDTVQITLAGARLLRHLREQAGYKASPLIYSRWDPAPGHCQFFAPTREFALNALHDHLSDDETRRTILHISGPVECGPWRACWWEKFDSGFRIDVRYIDDDDDSGPFGN